ncbi:DNA replication and repair protein RecF [Alloscardovia macacae]|uniref:DNA replication/repair protein RecF n=1 Tax=Alloscardovia macacae TaxID=1160091 RepID=UPI000A2D181B|nr:DNA replication/repair protein RecF [Alloscardovia macacae]OTA26817.1 DNA replication and repair protein RecF [Alloscardovia macacae]
MYISRLALDHFRSWEQCLLDLAPGITIFYGENGIGKTNIVEAVEFLSTGMSHRASSAKPLIQAGQPSAHIRANVEFSADLQTQYAVTLSSRGGHRARVNGGASGFLRDVLGQVPSVTFAPEDQRLVSAEPALRRQFLDTAATVLFPQYYELLQRYTHIAKQRAALLKNVAALRMQGDADLSQVFLGLEIWTTQLVQTGLELTDLRAEVCQKLAEPFARIYRHVAGETQRIQLTYLPSYGDDEYDAVIAHYQRLFDGEVAQARNLIGPHRDDLEFSLNGMNAKDYASNGEMWSIALALKMALFEVMKEAKETIPILILDDVFAQLDNARRSQILDFASQNDQVLITVAAKDDVPAQLLSTELQERVHFVDVEALRQAEEKLAEMPKLEDFLKHDA